MDYTGNLLRENIAKNILSNIGGWAKIILDSCLQGMSK